MRTKRTPGTVSTRPSLEAASWNSLKRQAPTQPVVDLDRPTWQLTMTGVLTAEPCRVLHRLSKSVSVGAAELQTGILMWTSPGKVSFSFSISLDRVIRSLTSTSDSFLLTSITLILPLARPSRTLINSSSSFLTDSLVTSPSSAYSPILLGGLAHTGLPLTYTIGSWRMFNQIILLVLG